MLLNRSRSSVLVALLATAALAGCSHNPPISAYPPTANPAEEIQNLDRDMNTLSQQGGDLLSPDHFSQARDHLADAKKAQEKGKDPGEILQDLGYARAQYDLAVGAGERSRALLPEVLTARNNAIKAGAPKLFPSEFKSAEGDFKDLTNEVEKGKELSADDRSKLQKKYMDVELTSIQKNRLGDVEAKIDHAKDMKAEKYAPQTFEEAQASLNSANSVIAADRTNEAQIGPAVAAANMKAQYLTDVNQVVADSKGDTSEASAIAIVNQRHQIARQQDALKMSQSANAKQASKIATLSAEASVDAKLDEAQKMFKPEEAEVYRKGDDLVIRLKKMGYGEGKTALTKQSKACLSKVKDVITMLGATKVVVEGHADTVGAEKMNQKLSKKRADVVKQYLISQKAIDKNAIESVGVGESEPMAPNTSKSGRAQNRRVDITITPATPSNPT